MSGARRSSPPGAPGRRPVGQSVGSTATCAGAPQLAGPTRARGEDVLVPLELGNGVGVAVAVHHQVEVGVLPHQVAGVGPLARPPACEAAGRQGRVHPARLRGRLGGGVGDRGREHGERDQVGADHGVASRRRTGPGCFASIGRAARATSGISITAATGTVRNDQTAQPAVTRRNTTSVQGGRGPRIRRTTQTASIAARTSQVGTEVYDGGAPLGEEPGPLADPEHPAVQPQGPAA